MSREVAEVLRKALAAFGPNGEKWVNHVPREDGIEHCSVTAIYFSHPLFEVRNRVHHCLNSLIKPFSLLSAWNDAPQRTFADVRALFEKAIAQEENDSTTEWMASQSEQSK